ncbi:TetR/AcrR family transcriptional regulator [Jiella mangrovi]|uniref:TetR/AcrR family transcriptional regulator n=1 Tax=Jiella mangrovi TaxID=2821407 RepID=A0ABS4BCG5_9HYPH|nr:TetR/AcrR family transcriptional regulator [Jiella mangrovi]MBP0614438.1 TetR/AcrR family transcriptional regulator [Jiella mangrovi]
MEKSAVVEKHWQRIAQQRRSKKTHETLLDAAETLILDGGADAATIAAIAARAGVSVGSVYHHFRDKQAIFIALSQRTLEFFQSLYSGFEDPAYFEGSTVRDIIRVYLEVSVSTLRHQLVARYATGAVATDQPEFVRNFARTMVWGREIALKHIIARKDEIGRSDPERCCRIMLDQLSAMYAGHIDPGRRAVALAPMEDEAFVEEAVTIASEYLALRGTDVPAAQD